MSDLDRVLVMLGEHGPTNVATLADLMDWTHARVRTALVAAEERGLASRA